MPYLHDVGYDVVPIRPDRAQVGGLPTYARLSDFSGSVDLVVIFGRPEAVPAHIDEAASKRPDAVWLPPGTWSRAAAEEAAKYQLAVVKDRCIIEEHRHLTGARGEPPSGHPRKPGVHVRKRRRRSEDGERESPGYVAGGGGGRRAGGGVRAVLDEKKERRD